MFYFMCIFYFYVFDKIRFARVNYTSLMSILGAFLFSKCVNDGGKFKSKTFEWAVEARPFQPLITFSTVICTNMG